MLVAVMLLAALAGCTTGKGKETDKGGDKGTDPGKVTEKQEITLNLGEEPPNLDSALATDSVSFDILNNVMEGLIRLGKDFKLMPGMATEWSTTDNINYTFKLRQDAKWSDGKPVTAHDFKYAWLRALDPKTASEYSYQLYEYIEGAEEFAHLDAAAADYEAKAKAAREKVAITVEGDYTLKVKLIAPTPYWLSLMAFPTYMPQRQDIVEKHGEKYAADAANMVFNGPFVIDTWTHESEIILKKNTNYWDAGNVKLEKATFKMIKDANTAIQMYETGEFDRVGLPGDFIPKYQSDGGFSSMAEATTVYLTFNTKRKEFQNVKLRQAFSLAIDRKGFADNVLKNGSVPAEGYVPGSMAGEGGKTFRQISGSHIQVSGNKGEAQKLWEEAKKELGVSKLTVSILHTDNSTTRRYVQGIQAMLQDNLPGLTVNLEAVTFAVRLDRAKKGDFDLVYQGWIGDYNDPMTFMNMFITGGSYNDSGWSNAQHDDLIKKAQTDRDNMKRMEYMAQAEKVLMTELPILPLYHPAANRVSRPYLKGILDFPLGGSTDLKGAYVEGKTK